MSHILVDPFLGKNVQDAGTQDLEGLGNNRAGCDVVLPGDVHFPCCAHDNPDIWTGKCGCFSLQASVSDI